MPLSRAALFTGLVAVLQAGLVVVMYGSGKAATSPLLAMYLASLGASYALLRRVGQWSGGAPGRHSPRFFLAVALAGAVQFAAVVVGLGVAFNIWGT